MPLLINELRRGDREAARRRLVGTGSIGPWGALGHLVGCNEYGASYRSAVAAIKPKLPPAFQVIADDFREHCDLWVANLAHQEDQTPVASTVPTLVTHGEFDPMDIQATQQRITAQLKRAYTYTFPGEGHAGSPVGCHGSIVQQFLENPTRAPDPSCLARMPRIQYKTQGFEPNVTYHHSRRRQCAESVRWHMGSESRERARLDDRVTRRGNVVRGTVLEELAPVREGKFDGPTLSFQINSFDGARTITLTGKLQGTELTLTREVAAAPGRGPGGPGLFGGPGLRTLVARRVPGAP
jgi:hypothetical protein